MPWLAFIAWLIAICILSSIPGNRFAPPPFSWADKAVHALLFTTGAFLLGSACRIFLTTSWKAALVILLAMVLIGAGDEYHQTYTPGRSGNDRGDLLADTVGALLGLGCARLLHGKRRPRANLMAPVGDRAA